MPFVDARLPDGSRVHAVLGTLASPGTCISLRVPAQRSFSPEDCVASGSLTPGTAELLSRMIEAKLAFLISGGTGSGKTTQPLRHYWDGGSRQFRMAAAHRYLRQTSTFPGRVRNG
jgi:Flp pilus assembly CpaF family ATPase